MEKKMRLTFVFSLVFLLHFSAALPLCNNQEAPNDVGSLQFCSQYSGTGCCSKSMDASISSQFQSMNISSPSCATYVKQVLCAKCDPLASDLFRERSVPLLCNSSSYCSDLWTACQNVVIPSSPFAPTLIGGAGSPPGSKLSDKSTADQTLAAQWQTDTNFCNSLGFSNISDDGSICFSGEKYKLPGPVKDTPPEGVCLEKVEEEGYIGMVPHPDGSNRAFLATQEGHVYLATLPDKGSGRPISVNKKTPFLDISNFVTYDREFGLMSIAFHPEYTKNGRFFVSYNCDKQKWSGCGGGICSCNADAGCDPSQVQNGDGSLPCQFSSVISEYVAGNSTVSPAEAVVADSSEVKRVLTIGLPYTTHHGGLMLFNPQDKYLYFMMGDGGGAEDPFNFAQNKKSLLGKILRLDVDKTPTDQDVTSMGLWGKYSIPEDNPFVKEDGSRPEIWALGLRNPWRCSFDIARPEYLYCADVGQVLYEEVNVITKGGNYGWRTFDGFNYTARNTSVIDHPIFPVATYFHNEVNKQQGSASIIGGYISRSVEDACTYGRYLYADLYGANMWSMIENPTNSGNYTTAAVNFTCSASSPVPCTLVPGSKLPEVGFVFAWGEDNSRNVYILATKGVFKFISPEKCNFSCTKKLPASAKVPALTPIPSPRASPPSPSTKSFSSLTTASRTLLLLLLLVVLGL